MANRTLTYTGLGQAAPAPQPVAAKTIPFDYLFKFTLTGVRNNLVQDVVEISVEGVFVAVSIGYSLVPDLVEEGFVPRSFEPVTEPAPQAPVPVPLFTDATAQTLSGFLVVGMPGAEIDILDVTDRTDDVPPGFIEPRNIKIGADGTVPVTLLRAVSGQHTFRLWDKTNNVLSELFQTGQPVTPVIGPGNPKLPAEGVRTVTAYGSPGTQVNVFLLRKGEANWKHVGENPVSLVADTGLVPGLTAGKAVLSLSDPESLEGGDVLLVRTAAFTGPDPSSMYVVPASRTLFNLTLGEIAAGLEQKGMDLTLGFRLNPLLASVATADLRLDQLSAATRSRLFEGGCVAAEEVSFLYSIDVAGTGRELQNKAIHNIAGLGIANGDRPFRPLAKPVAFEPRSFIRFQIQELRTVPGTLFLVLQGYKILGAGRTPG